MKILVTGGAGFIGSHIVDKMIEKDYEVVVVDDLSTGRKENLNPKAKFYRLDIRSFAELEKVFEKEKFEFVCHQAAHVSVRESLQDPVFDAQVNILGSLNILQGCLKYGIKKVIFASTGGALYGDADILPTSETYPPKPISPYGVSKLSVEHYLHYYKMEYKLDYVVLRYANVYGPRQDPFGEAGVVAIFSQKIAKNAQPIINGDGKQTRDFIYVDDVVSANLLALKSDFTDTFNVGTGKQTSINELFHLLVSISGKKVKEVHGPEQKGEQRVSALDCRKIKEKLGWEPKVKLEDGLRKTYEWFVLQERKR